MPSRTRTSEARPQLFLQQAAERLGHVAVEDDEERLSLREGLGQRLDDPAGEAGQASVGRRAAPAEREGDFRARLRRDRSCGSDSGWQSPPLTGRPSRPAPRAAGSPAGSCAAAAPAGSRCTQCCPTTARCIPRRQARWRGCIRPPAGAGTGTVPHRAAHGRRDQDAGRGRRSHAPRVRTRIRSPRPRTSRPRCHPGRQAARSATDPATSPGAGCCVSAATRASAIHEVTRWSSASVTVSPRFQSHPASAARCFPAGSRRVSRPSASITARRPPRWIAAVCTILPSSTTASFVVPPPMSTLRTAARRSCEACGRARAVRGEHRLHVVAGRGADELAADLREHVGDRPGVLAPQRFAGEDDRPGVDAVRMHAGGLVGGVDDPPDRLDRRCVPR